VLHAIASYVTVIVIAATLIQLFTRFPVVTWVLALWAASPSRSDVHPR
jgi:hypothetical protein